MRCFHQPLAFLFLSIGFGGLAWSQPSFTWWRSTITAPCGVSTPGATVTTVNHATIITSMQAASGQLGNEHVLLGVYE